MPAYTYFWALMIFSLLTPAWAAEPVVDLVRVSKTDKTLVLFSGKKERASFPVVFGANPQGHKQEEGDSRTPEGRYTLDYRNPNSAYFRSLHVSYPNAEDIRSAKRRGVKPGSLIMIHGQKNGFGHLSAQTQKQNWTDGCIALSDEDMQRVWDLVPIPTRIEISP